MVRSRVATKSSPPPTGAEAHPGITYFRRYWRGLLVRQCIVWAVICGLIAVFRPAELASAWPVILLGGLLLNLAWTFVA